MKIIIFKSNTSTLSRLISIITGSDYSHSAILLKHDNLCYFTDSSFTERGVLLTKLSDIEEYLNSREYVIYDIQTTDKDYKAFTRASELVSESYDTTGVILWSFFKMFRITNKKYYCFEYTIEILKQYYFIEDDVSRNPNGDTIISLADKFGFKARFLNCNKVR